MSSALYYVHSDVWEKVIITDEESYRKCACVCIGCVMLMICVGTKRMLGPECARTLDISTAKADSNSGEFKFKQ